ncbi:threonine ammonia-lyase [Acididesulfobacillus acetoxydans]|uniref:threonine ammonia-lyase n=1 Tax=Acididesulfobacillus acetoxydans TaxID=1561005 RepID=A0A8S0XUL3_9FIRM|nr:threonine ammonia-lyase [Acididesulfobacillus acetoxydans]CAA7599537.1 threonine ammonia-lyase [Acididesulfobacillus acetoxydans]CEJ07732.1 L-threonine dehydratase catabolic TdcB [Acididesulfobacillus acetoxydans]
MQVTVEEIKKARATLDGVISRTGLSYSNILSEMSGNEVYLKMENLQRTGSFKVRGAYNKVANLSEQDKENGVIASSAGNHAQGVALAATTFGIKSTIVMPKHAPLSKVIATQGYGAKVVLHGDVYDDAYAEARRIQKEENATFVHPFDDPLVIAGQGTIALELLEDLPDVEAVVVPIGGGGLISGIAVALKEMKPSIKVIGVQTKNMPSMAQAMAQKQVVTVDGIPTIADGIAVKTPGALTFELCQHYVDEIVTVDEEEIARAILLLLERVKTVAEGAGAVSIAAVLSSFPAYKHRKIAALISGGNIDVNTVTRIINKGLVKSGRKVFFDTVISDKPGELWQLLKLIADANANVLAVTHSRESRDVALGSCRVELELETANEEQIAKIRKLMEERHYSVDMR